MYAKWSRYLFKETSSGILREMNAAQNNSRKRQSSSHRAPLSEGLSALPYLMVRSMSSCARANAPSARLSLPASRALSAREVSLPMFAICCDRGISAQRPFSSAECCIYPMMNRETISLMASLLPGFRTSRDGLPCHERILINESNSMKSSPVSSGYRLNPHKCSCCEPSSRRRRSKSACSSASRASFPLLISATHLIISPKVFWASILSSSLDMGWRSICITISFDKGTNNK